MKRRQQAFTVVELMMALAIFTVGVSGIVALQRAVVVSNQHSKNIAAATQIAQAWVSELHADALQWNTPAGAVLASDLNQTNWLNLVTTSPGVWVQPAYSGPGARNFGPAFDALGNVVNPATALAQAHFCTNIRLSTLTNALATGPEGIIRAEVRVFWLRTGQGAALPTCSPALVITTGPGGNANSFHFVQTVAAIRQNVL
jgi:prepilin-type N-terminal cleavage/methylation domain-containing protein